MKENKIVYCYDELGNTVYYKDVAKGNKYTCIDCGQELLVKDGVVKNKHLSHKGGKSCGGTGETVFHKHWKESLFSKGMYINIHEDLYEIHNVITEVSLRDRYSKNWDRDIIVDVLLETNSGDVIVEINYSNKKQWLELEDYYNTLELLEVYEVSVSKEVNSKLIWKTMGDCLVSERKQHEMRVSRMIDAKRKRDRVAATNRDTKGLLLFNFKTVQSLENTDGGISTFNCVFAKDGSYFSPVKVVVDSKKVEIDEDVFEIKKGIVKLPVSIRGYDQELKETQTVWLTGIDDGYSEFPYDKAAYVALCSVAESKQVSCWGKQDKSCANELLKELLEL